MTDQDRKKNEPFSPLAFTRAFQEYREKAAHTLFIDSRLLLAARFWSEHSAALTDDKLDTYRQQDLPPLLAEIKIQDLHDLTAEQSGEIASFIDRIRPLFPDDAKANTTRARSLHELAARQWLYLGDVGNALAELMKSGTCAVPSSEEFDVLLKNLGELNATEIPERLAEHVATDYPDLAGWLNAFGREWELTREGGALDAVSCLLVEYDQTGRACRGRLRRLVGKVEQAGKSAEADEVIFHHQVKAPDDPFIGTVYNALAALRSLMKNRQGYPDWRNLRTPKTRGRQTSSSAPSAPSGRQMSTSAPPPTSRGPYLHGRFSFIGNESDVYSGDSIGLAAFAVAYGSWWNKEIHRERRLISRGAAFTGGIGNAGEIQPVAEDSLSFKVERAFRSPISHLVVPEANRPAAEKIVADLRKTYPHRRLQVVGIERPPDILSDHNIFHPEKVCLGEFAIEKAKHYSRGAKVQIPMLVVLLAILGALVGQLFPRQMPWFDDNPIFAISNPHTNSLETYNRDSTLLWTDPLSCPLSKVSSGVIRSISFGHPYDFDGDGKNEVVFLPAIDEICDDRALLRFYSHDGRLLWERNAAILGRHPKDTAGVQYDVGRLWIVQTSDGPAIVSVVFQEMPARAHIRFWSAAGDSLGWYFHWGHGSIEKIADLDHDGREEIFFVAINNRNRCVALTVLRPDSVHGFSPRESDIENNASWWVPGSQVAYMLFPKSDVGCLPGELPSGYNYPSPNGIRLADDGQIQVHVSESVNYEHAAQLIYTIDHRLRVVKVAMNDYLVTHRGNLVAEGKLPPIDDWSAYFARLRDTVTYWTASGWITEGQLRAYDSLK